MGLSFGEKEGNEAEKRQRPERELLNSDSSFLSRVIVLDQIPD
jgi:hypothetical protein